MRVTVTIPDEFAAQVQAQGVSPERYIELWAARQIVHPEQFSSQAAKLAELETFLAEMSAHSDSVPLLPDSAFMRESFYQDRG